MSELTYKTNGDYRIPNLELSDQSQQPLSKYGRLRKAYLQENRPVLWYSLILSEKLFPHLREIDETANRRLETIMAQMQKSAGVTEQMKRENPMKWVGMMNMIKLEAEEVFLKELIYA